MRMAPLVPITVAFAAGIALASWRQPAASVLILAGVSCGWIARRNRHPAARVGCLCGVWVCVGMLHAAVHPHVLTGEELPAIVPSHHLARLATDQPQRIALHGIVVRDPVALTASRRPADVTPTTEPPATPRDDEMIGQRTVVHASHLRLQGDWRCATGLVRVRLRTPRHALQYGDEVLLEGMLSRIPSPGNPGQFDARATLARQGVHAGMAVEPFDGMVRLRRHRGHPVIGTIIRFRHRLERSLREHLDHPHAELLRALLLGQRVALEPRLKRAFVETGTMHLVVVSGFNVGIIALLVEWLLRLAGMPRSWRLGAAACVLGGYWIVTGMQAPVTRATVMAWAVLAALWRDRVIHWPNVLAFAALVIVWVAPTQLWDPGFQLSFGAVASLLAFAAPCHARWQRWLPIRPARLRRYVSLSLAATCAIWVGLWPLLAWYFFLIAPVSILANLLLVPLISVVVAVGTPLVIIGALLPAVMQATAGWLTAWVDVMIACVLWCQSIPWGSWVIGRPSWALIAGYYALLVVSISRSHSWKQTAAWWLLGVNLWVWPSLAHRVMLARWLEVTILDVGHGDALVVRAPNRHTILIDAGTTAAGDAVVVPFLRLQGWSTLDALILTHPDADHLGGAIPVLEHVRVRRLLTNGFAAETPTARRVVQLAGTRGLAVGPLAAGSQLTGLADVEARVLHPPAEGIPGLPRSSNDNSLVLKLTIGQVSLLLCADVDEGGLPWLLRWDRALRATVLKVPHHGSDVGVRQSQLFDRVRPQVAVISVGRLHRLPQASVVRDLSKTGTQVLMTRDAGAVSFRTDGQRLWMKAYQEGNRWQELDVE